MTNHDRWETIALSAVCELITKGSSPRWQGFEYSPTGVAFITSENVRDGVLDTSQPKFLPQKFHDKHQNSQLRKGDLLLNIVGASIGRACLYDGRFGEANINQAVCLIRPKSGYDPEFLLQVLQAPRIQERLIGLQTDGARANISLSQVRELTLDLPSEAERCGIVEVLRTWDEAIEKSERLIAAKERRLDWLRIYIAGGRVRLPGFSQKWEAVRLSAVLHEHGETSSGAEPVYSVSVRRGLVDQIEHLGRSFAAANTNHYNRVLPGDLVYTKSPTGDFPWGIIKQSAASRPVIVSPLYGVFTPATKALGTLLDLHFTSPVATTNYLAPLVQKGAKNTISITNGRFLEGKLLLPLDPSEQAAIASIIECARSEVDLLQRQRDALTKQKRGLVQKLLTGEWSVRGGGTEEAAA